jgi:hypothetical protein
MLTSEVNRIHPQRSRRGCALHPAGASPLRPLQNQNRSYAWWIESAVSLPLVGPGDHAPSERKNHRLQVYPNFGIILY